MFNELLHNSLLGCILNDGALIKTATWWEIRILRFLLGNLNDTGGQKKLNILQLHYE